MPTNSTPRRETQQRNGDNQMLHQPTHNEEPRKPRLGKKVSPGTWLSLGWLVVGIARLFVGRR